MNRKKPAKTVKKTKVQEETIVPSFPVVGIGASAGGLEAISQLLSHLLPNLGMAYVIVQHLSPTHESLLPELLQRKTAMPVHTVKDGIKIEADNVYVIPPATFMTITDGHLALSDRGIRDKPYHLIDDFLISLAPIYKQNAIAVILSGVGMDGTEGVQAIKASGGITFAQDDSALFQAMARSAYESGYIDFILPPEGIASELSNYVLHEYAETPLMDEVEINDRDIRQIFILLNNKCGVDFSQYKQTTINRRIIRRMSLNRLKKMGDYVRLLAEKNAEIELLYRDLLINVTNFFREPAMFDALTQKVFPTLFGDRKPEDPVRIWIPACASGEEACSMAIAIFEYLGDQASNTPIQIFATDLSEHAIDKARSGIYSQASLVQMSPQRTKQFFIKTDGNYQVIKAIRDICIFATHNLLKDPPFSRMDLISCQNVMIYLAPNAQKKVLQAFHYALKPNSWLVLGKSESTGSDTDLFEVLDKEQKIYTRRTVTQNMNFDFFRNTSTSSGVSHTQHGKNIYTQNIDANIDTETDKLLLARYVPACLVVNKDLQILRFHGPINNYLQPAAGKASLHLLKMVKDELVFELRGMLNRVKKEGHLVVKENIRINDGRQHRDIHIDVMPVKTHVPQESWYLIVFKESEAGIHPQHREVPVKKGGRQDSKDKRIQLLEQDIKEAREHMKSMNEEFEANREELQSANEEILSSNEELQSINEELETSKEEMQSTNEELITINEELQLRNIDLKELVDYSEAIVETIREPLVVLHTDLRMRRANQSFYTLFNLGKDIEGQYFFEISKGMLDVPELRKLLQKTVTKGIGFQDFELRHHFKDLGEKILVFNAMRMSSENSKRTRILLAIEDVTERKLAEESLYLTSERYRLAEERLRVAMQAGKMGAWNWNMDTGIINWSWEHPLIPVTTLEYQVKNEADFFKPLHPDEKKAIAEQVQFALAHKKDFTAEVRALSAEGNIHWIAFLGRPFYTSDEKASRMVGVVMDITNRKNLEKQKEEFIGIASHELRTPVSSLKSYTQLLLDILGEKNDEDSVELVEKLHKQIDRLTLLITDLLDVTRINEGRLELNKAPFDLNELIIDVAEQLQRTTERHKILFEAAGIMNVYGDKERVRQVFVNLLSNAIKYSPATDKVLLSVSASEKEVTVCVKDFGIGMTNATSKLVFDRFYRGNEQYGNTYPGLGLGLYIAADVIYRHGGKIWVESEPGKGASFYFTLPVNQ